jgi:hypothetical protein
VLIKLLLLLPALAFGHGGGHGPKVEGTGPSGGKLTSVILAADAELGERAASRAVAEWVLKGETLRVTLWNSERTQKIQPSGSEVKWILLGKKLPKPEVVKGQSLELKRSFAGVEQVELILPSLDLATEKHVTIFSLPKKK